MTFLVHRSGFNVLQPDSHADCCSLNCNVLIGVGSCSWRLDGKTTLDQLSDVCGLFLMQAEDKILQAEAKAQGQRFNPVAHSSLAVLTGVGWLQKLINRALSADQCTAPVRSRAASLSFSDALMKGELSAGWPDA